MAKKKSKTKSLTVARSLNKLLASLITRYAHILRRRFRRNKNKKNNTKGTLLPTTTKPAHTGNTPIIVHNNENKKLATEQQEKKPESTKEHAKEPTNNQLMLPAKTPSKSRTVSIPGATPRKLEFSDGNVHIYNERNGQSITLKEKDMKEITDNHVKAKELREKADAAEDIADRAILEAQAAKQEKEAIRKTKEATDKLLEKERLRSVDLDVKSKEGFISAKTLKNIYIYATDNNLLEAKQITRQDQFLTELNTLPDFKTFVSETDLPDIDPGEHKTAKANKKKTWENQFFTDITTFLDPQAGNGFGKGDFSEGTLSNLQIDQIMKRKKIQDWEGVYALDTLPSLRESTEGGKYNFIVNTNAIGNPTVGHWVAVRVTPDVIEYYDPLGLLPSPAMKKALSHAIGFNGNRQFKINRMQDQNIYSTNCGWFAMKFLEGRAKGDPWISATGFNKLGEKEISKYKKSSFRFKNI